MSIQLRISPRIINSISSVYNDVLRIFMEWPLFLKLRKDSDHEEKIKKHLYQSILKNRSKS